jgi:hypothetical protein
MIMHRRAKAQRNIPPSVTYSIGISASSSNPQVIQGSTTQITYTLTRYSGYSGTVNISVSGLPSGVTGAFSNSTLTGATLTTVLTLTADPAATLITDKVYSVTASGSGVSDAVIGDLLDVIVTPVGAIPFVVTRWDGNSGAVMVNGTIPLPPGRLTDATLQNFRVYDSGNNEKTIAKKRLLGSFPDGSPRSIAVQFLHNVTNNTPESFSVVFGSTRGTTDFTYVEPVYGNGSTPITTAAMKNKAIFIPDDADYWISTFVALVPLVSEANTTASAAKNWYSTVSTGETGLYNQVISLFPTVASATITDVPPSLYDQGHALLCGAIRASTTATRLFFYQRYHDYTISCFVTATSNYFHPAPNMDGAGGNGYAFMVGYDATLPTRAAVGDDGTQATEAKAGYNLEMACFYLMTGWSHTWRKLAYKASSGWGSATDYTSLRDRLIGATSDNSMRFNFNKLIGPLLAAYVVEANTQVTNSPGSGFGAGRDNNTYAWTDTITWIIDGLDYYKFTTPSYKAGVVGVRPTQDTSPYYGGSLGAGGFVNNFTCAVACKWLIFIHHNIINDSRIPIAVQAFADYLISQLYFESTGSCVALSYAENSNFAAVAQTLVPDAGAYPATPSYGSLEDWWYGPYLSEIFGFTYAYTANSTYKTWGDRCASKNAQFVPNVAYVSAPYRNATDGVTLKLLGEIFCGTNQSYLHYAQGGSLRPVSGAHPTAVANQTTHTTP